MKCGACIFDFNIETTTRVC